MRARVPQRLRRGQKSEGVRQKEGKRANKCSSRPAVSLPPLVPGSAGPQGAASLQPCGNTRALVSPTAHRRKSCLPKPNLQHMPPPNLPPLPPTPPHPQHTHAYTHSTTTSSLPPHPAAEGDVFPRAITTVRCKVCFCSWHQVFASWTFTFSHLGKQNVAGEGGGQPAHWTIAPFLFWVTDPTQLQIRETKVGGVCGISLQSTCMHTNHKGRKYRF